jgi:TPR repeat protein
MSFWKRLLAVEIQSHPTGESADEMAAEIIRHAENGDPTAQCDVGAIGYKAGNYSEARRWHTKSAIQGNATAQANLGIMFEFGDGVPKGYSEAVH